MRSRMLGTSARRAQAATIVVGVLLTALVTLLAQRTDEAEQRSRDDEARAQAVGALQVRTQALEDRITDVVGLFAASDAVSAREYRLFTRRIIAARDARTVTWMVNVAQDERRAFEREIGRRILTPDADNRLVPATNQGRAFVVRYDVQAGAGRDLVGFDAFATGVGRGVIARAAATGRVQSSRPTQLIGSRRPGFILYAPVPATDGSLGLLRVRGVVGASFAFADLRQAVLSAVPDETDVDIHLAGEHVLQVGADVEDGEQTAFEFGGQRWTVRTRAAAAPGPGSAIVALVAGLLLTALALAFVRSRGTRRLLASRDEARLRAESRFREAFASAPIGFALVEPTGRIVRINEAYCRMLGLTEQEALTTNALRLVAPDDRHIGSDQFLRALHTPGVAIRCEARAVTREGLRWLESHATYIPDEDIVLIQTVDIDDRRRFEEQLRHQAEHDPLTDLLNRRGLNRVLAAHLEASAGRPRGAVMLLDLDHFKTVNDLHGHRVGDEVLQSVAQVLTQTVRDHDTVARLGGDEFAVLLPDADAARARAAASRLVDAISAEAQVAALGGGHGVPASVGVAMLDGSMTTPEEALTAADLAMYDAKDAGRGRFAFYDSQADAPSATRDRLVWVERVRAALNERRLRLVAQPIRHTRERTIVHHELLLLLVEPDGTEIAPGLFLPIAEQFGLIEDIDLYVARAAIDLLQRHADHDVVFHANLSGRSMGNADLLTTISAELERTGVDPSRLVFEVTETAAVTNLEEARRFAEALGALGCRLALDDFGAGFGSFTYLKQLPFDILKIDGEFVRHCAGSATDRVILESLLHAARGLDKTTVAEFVEDEATEQLLRELGVDFVQGFHIGRPVSVQEALRNLPPGSPPTTATRSS
jgi:diguanylate cyclase (GGDEF)-like protein/PAS domain S-box-containing protein